MITIYRDNGDDRMVKNILKQAICVLILFLLMGCITVVNEAPPTEIVQGDHAQLEEAVLEQIVQEPIIQEQTPIQEKVSAQPEPLQKEHPFDKTIEMLENTIFGYEDDNSNWCQLNGNTFAIRLDTPQALNRFKPDYSPYIVDLIEINLKAKTAIGYKEWCPQGEELCYPEDGFTVEYNYNDFDTKTPLHWLKEYREVEMVGKPESVLVGSTTTTKYEFIDGTTLWLNYKGIPVKVKQGRQITGFYDIALA